MAKTNITRREGESEADFQRRYKREYMRAYYAKKRAENPKPKKKRGGYARRMKFNIAHREGETQEEFNRRYGVERQRILRARAKGAPSDVSGEVLVKTPRKGLDISQAEWEALRQQPGESVADWERRNQHARYVRWRDKDPQHVYETRKKWRTDNAEWDRERSKNWRLNNPDKVRAGGRRYFERNRAARLHKLNMWAVANPERAKEAKRLWWAANPEKQQRYNRERLFRIALATPLWADPEAIAAIYDERDRIVDETGIPHDVDHEIPLVHPLVCGLHVQGNLRIMTARDNRKKRNKFNPADFDWPQKET